MKSLFSGFGLVAVVGIILNLAFLAGAIWVVVWVLRATGVLHS